MWARALGLAAVCAALSGWMTPARAAFVSGVEHFSGTTIDTATWQAYPGPSDLSQNDGLTIDTRFSPPTTPRAADLTTQVATVGIGASVSVTASIEQRTSNGNTPSLSVFLTTNDNGASTPTGNDSHWLALVSTSTIIQDLVGGNGGGSGHILRSTPQPLNETYTFQIERLTQTSARFKIFDSTNALLVSNIETFTGVPDNLYVSLQTSSMQGNFQTVTISSLVPEPGTMSAAAWVMVLIARRQRR